MFSLNMLTQLCTFFDGVSGESVRAFIVFLLVNRVVAAIDSQKSNKIIGHLPRIRSPKNVQSRV